MSVEIEVKERSKSRTYSGEVPVSLFSEARRHELFRFEEARDKINALYGLNLRVDEIRNKSHTSPWCCALRALTGPCK